MNVHSENARIRAALMNTGKYTMEEADAKLSASSLSIYIGDDVARTDAGQAAFLTAVADGARCFGYIHVIGALEVPLIVPLPLNVTTLAEAAVALGASLKAGQGESRWIKVGSGFDSGSAWAICPYWNGWIAGVSPEGIQSRIGRSDCVLAGIAAGALAVGQAFLAEQGDVRAGHFNYHVSLWSPHEFAPDGENPNMNEVRLPKKLWLIGLGNLGQAYLWSLFMLPYEKPEDVTLFLQDNDIVNPENWGTSVLVEKGRYDVLKTFVAEEWAMRRRFNVRRIDRRVDKHLRRTDQEPSIALAGLDSMPARRLLGEVGFDCIIDCGLGATASNYTNYRMNIFDRNYNPARHFTDVEDRVDDRIKTLMELPAYKELSKTLNDGGCGAAILAGKSVAAPFVSAFVCALAIAQAIKLVSGKLPAVTIAGNTGDLKTLRAELSEQSKKVFFETTAVKV